MQINIRLIFLSLFLLSHLEINSQVNISNLTPQQIEAISNLSDEELSKYAKQLEINKVDEINKLDKEGTQSENYLINNAETNYSEVKSLEDQELDNKQQVEQDEDIDNSKDSFKVFGHSVFNKRVSTFAPADNLPVPNDYVLGPGDQLIIKLLGTENFEFSPTISRDGSIFINKIGEIVLSGLTLAESIALIKQRINSELIGVQPTISMGRIKSINVFISGEVNRPGMYSLSSLTTITQSLYQAGGITDIGSIRNIQVLRNGVVVNSFDAYDLLVYGNSVNDIRLRSGDVVFIPPMQGVVTISGAIKRNYKYEITENDTFADLLVWSGGFTEDANPDFSYLLRSLERGALPQSSNINLSLSSNLEMLLIHNDRINIPKIGDATLNTVSIEGAVNRSGPVGWYPGLKLSNLFSDFFEDFTHEADPFFAYIVRFNQDTFQYEVLSFSPIDILNNKNSADFLVNEKDKIVILNKDPETRNSQIAETISMLKNQANINEPQMTVSIKGAIRYPNEYPLFKNSTVGTLVQAAGGFLDTAFLDSIEVARKVSDQNSFINQTLSNLSSSDISKFKLQSRDSILVRSIDNLKTYETVSINGRVQFPGEYNYIEGERLSDLVARAGGIRKDGFISGAILQRTSAQILQKDANNRLANQLKKSYASSLLTADGNNNSIDEIIKLSDIITNSKPIGRVSIDLNRALNDEEKYNLYLEPEDILTIPFKNNSVTVIGEVNNENTVFYDSNLKVSDYISLAGGFSKKANKDNIYIIRANGSIIPINNGFYRFGLSRASLEPGDTVVVPIDYDYTDNLSLWTEVTQVIYQTMVSLAAIDRISTN
jgi:polysaccharide export outer membrane protein